MDGDCNPATRFFLLIFSINFLYVCYMKRLLFILILVITIPEHSFSQFDYQEYCKERANDENRMGDDDVDYACYAIEESSRYLEHVMIEQNDLRLYYEDIRDSFSLVNNILVSQITNIVDSIKLIDDKLNVLTTNFNAYTKLDEITNDHMSSTKEYCKRLSSENSQYRAPTYKLGADKKPILVNNRYVYLSEEEKDRISFSKILGKRFIGHEQHVFHIISDSEDLKKIIKIDDVRCNSKLIYFFKKDIRGAERISLNNYSSYTNSDYSTHLSILSIILDSNEVEIKNLTYSTESKEYKKILKRITNKKSNGFIGNDLLFNDSLLIDISNTKEFFNLRILREKLESKKDSLFIQKSLYSNKTIEEAIMQDSIKLEKLINYYEEFPSYAKNYIEEYVNALELYKKDYEQYLEDKKRLNKIYPKLKSFSRNEATKTLNSLNKILRFPLSSPSLKDYGWYFDEDFSKWCPCVKLVWIEVDYRENVSNNSSGYKATKKYLCSIIDGKLHKAWHNEGRELITSVQLSYLRDTPCNWIPFANPPEYSLPEYNELKDFWGFYDHTILTREMERSGPQYDNGPDY